MPLSDPDARRAYQRQWMAQRRAAFFADKSCVRCGSCENLELDHVDPSLKISHRIWTWSAERRAAELAKCQVLCQSCHREKTTSQMVWRAEHGTDAMYTGPRACRCAPCTEAHRAKKKAWRAARRAAGLPYT